MTRAREDMVSMALQARQRLNAFLLRHGQVYREGKSRWTQKHFCWLRELRFTSPLQQLVFEEYVEAVKVALRRITVLDDQLRAAMEISSLRPVVEGLMALRGVSLVTALTLVAELGDITRFDSPRQLMAYLGLVPSEHTSGGSRRQGGITRTGNGHVRRVLVEAAWNYRFMARRSRVIEMRATKTSVPIQSIAWEAQKRLCHRYRHLMEIGKQKNQVTVAIARELVGFIWAIGCEVVGKPHGSRALA